MISTTTFVVTVAFLAAVLIYREITRESQMYSKFNLALDDPPYDYLFGIIADMPDIQIFMDRGKYGKRIMISPIGFDKQEAENYGLVFEWHEDTWRNALGRENLHGYIIIEVAMRELMHNIAVQKENKTKDKS